VVQSNQVEPGEVLLELEDIHMCFGRVGALAGVSLQVRKGEIHRMYCNPWWRGQYRAPGAYDARPEGHWINRDAKLSGGYL